MLSLGVVLALVFIAIIILVVFFQFIPFGLWRVSFFTRFGMRFRRVDPKAIVFPLISAHKAGIALGVNDLEGHYLAGGNVQRVVNALISADKAGIALTYKQATAIDLAGRSPGSRSGPTSTGWSAAPARRPSWRGWARGSSAPSARRCLTRRCWRIRT